MRAVFCGTPDFAVPGLVALVEAGIEVALVVSQPDRVRGRRGVPTPTPVRHRATELGLPTAVLVKGQRSALYEQILATRPDVVVVVAFGHIVREPLLSGARLGCVNVHASLLPRWRGPAPIHTAIVAGDTETGVCTMRLAAGVDTGDTYAFARTPIEPDDTAGSLHDRLAALGAPLLVETLRGLDSGSLSAQPQDEDGVCHAPMLKKDEGSVDFSSPAQRVHDRIRGLDPWPQVAVICEGARVKISASTVVEAETAGAEPGSIVAIDENAMVVACADGCVAIASIQPEGRRAMRPIEFARGHGLALGSRLTALDGFVAREPRA